MPTVTSILGELKKKGTAQAQKTYARHGMLPEKTFGVSIADLKLIAKIIKGQQQLACELFATGKMEAMYLAALVADGARMTEKQLDQWAEDASDLRMVAECNVPWVTVENPKARELARKWMKSKKELVASAGWSTYSGLVAVTADDQLDLKEIEKLLATVVKEIKTAPNRVRYTMNSFVICVGCYVKPLSKQAKAAAKQIGAVPVDVGDTECKIPLATAYIEKVESKGRLGQKKKTIRC
jgi:3-methyladenine DNA glycosylase AlkD